MSVVSPKQSLSVAEAIRLLQHRAAPRRAEAIQFLGQLGDEAIEYLKHFKNAVNDVDQSVRHAAARVICGLGEIATPAMARMLGHPDKYVRRHAVWGLGRLGARAKPALPQLCQTLRDADARTATGAAQTIGGMREHAAEAIPSLVTAMRGTNVVLCRIAAKALSDIGLLALPALLNELHHHDIFVKGEAAMALGWLGSNAGDAVPGLIEILHIPSNHPSVAIDDSTPPSTEDAARSAAATALGRIGIVSQDVQHILTKCLYDPCPAVRNAAEQSMRILKLNPL